MKTDKCRSCNAPIRWAVTEKGRRIPIDAVPVIGGNLVLRPQMHREPLAIYMKGDHTVKRFVSHFVTCPQSKNWRKR